MTIASDKVLHNWNHDDPDDAKREIFEALGDIDGLEIAGTQVLLGMYCRPAKTRGGIITPGSSQREDIYQGTVALVIMSGPKAFLGQKEDWPDHRPVVGEWVYFRSQDGVRCSIKGPGSKMRKTEDGKSNIREWEGWQCYLVYDRDVYARVRLPHVVI